MIAVIQARSRAFQCFDSSRQATLKLLVIIGVEDIMLAIVLRLEYRIDAGQSRCQEVARRRSLHPAAIGEAAPRKVGIGKIAPSIPYAFVDHRLQTGAIRAGSGAEYARGRLLLRQFRVETGGPKPVRRASCGRADRVGVVRFIKLRDGANRRIQQIDLTGKRIAKHA